MQDEAQTRDELFRETQALRQEIARLKQVEEDLRESEGKYRSLFEASTDAVFLETLDGRLLDCNTTACEIFGYSREELLELTVADLVPQEIAATLPEIIAETLATGGIFVEAVNKRKDGQLFPIEINTQIVTLGGEQRLIAYVRDITERVRLEQQIEERRLHLERILDCAPDAIVSLDPQHRIVEWNQGAETLFGYSAQEALGRDLDDLIAAFDDGIFEEATSLTRQVLGGKPVFPGERVRFRQDGSPVHVIVAASPILDQGKLLGVVAIYTDITERKQALDEIQHLKEFNESIVQNMAEGIVVQDVAGTLIFVNPAAAAMLGYEIKELLESHWTMTVPADQHPLVEEADRRRARGESSRYQVDLIRKNGTRLPVLISGSPRFRDGRFEGSLAVFTDISERVQVEEQLTRRAREMAALYETSLEINSQPDLMTLLNAIVRRAAEMAGAKMGGLYLTCKGGVELELVVGYNIAGDYIGARLRLGEGASGRVAQTGKPLMVPDYQAWEGKSEIYAGYPFRRVLSVPLKVGERIIGVINVTDDEQTGFFDKEANRLVNLFADQAAIAVENARLLEAEARRRNEAETLRAATQALSSTLDLQQVFELILNELGKVVPYDSATVQQLKGGWMKIIGGQGFPNLDSLVGVGFDLNAKDNPNRLVARTRSPLILADAPAHYQEFRREPHAPAGIRSWLGVPLLFGDRLIGMIALDKKEPGYYTQEHANLALAFAAQAAIAIENARLFQAEREQRELAEALRHAAAAVSSTLDLEQILDHILEQVDRVIPNDAVNVNLIEGEQARIVRSRGYERFGQDLSAVSLVVADTPTLRQIQETGQTLVIADTLEYSDWVRVPQVSWVRSYAGAPILVRDRVLGFLNVDSATAGFFDQTHADRLQAFADQAGLALENARLFREMNRRVEYLDTLNRLGLAITTDLDLTKVLATLYDQIRRIVDVGAFYVALYDEESKLIDFPLLTGIAGPHKIEPLHIERRPGITGYVIQSKQPLYVPDTRAIPPEAPYHLIPLVDTPTRSYIGVPLTIREKVIGVLSIQSYEPKAYTQADVDLLTTIASQASIAIDNARLFQIVEQGKRDWETTFDAMQDAVVLVDHRYCIVRANQAFADLVGKTLIDLVGQEYPRLVAGTTDKEPFPLLKCEAEDDQPATRLHEHRDRVFEVQSTPLPQGGIGGTNRAAGLILVMRDITERRQAEKEIRRRNRELALLNRVIAASAVSQDAVSILETVCQELAQAFDVPQSAAALFNRQKTEAVVVAEYLAQGRPPSLGEIIPIEGNPSSEYLLWHKAPLVVTDTRTDARVAPIRDLMQRRGTASLLLLPLVIEGEVLGSLGIDAVEPRSFSADEVALAQRVAEQVSGALSRARLEETQRRLSAAVEQAAEAIFIAETDGTIFYVNPAFERLSGYSRTEAIGQNPRLLKSGEHDDAFYRKLWQTINSGKAWQGRFINRRKDGSLFTEEATITPVRNQAGEIVNFVATMRDVTRVVELEGQVYHAQKMEALGQMAGGIAHDFNNLLTVILLSTRLLERRLRPEDPLWEHVQRIRETGERAAALTKQLLRFSRRDVVEPEVLDLNQVVDDLSLMLQRIIGENIQLVLNLTDDLWLVQIDPSQLDQVIMNLVVNARDAMPEGGALTIETGNVVFDADYVAAHVDAQPGKHAMLSICDTGVGMDEKVRSHLFEPFFTTKERGQGTGLGLPTVFGIVRQNRGHICVSSEVGQGTTLQVFLPAVKADKVPAEPAPRSLPTAASKLVRGSETVLVVEDEQDVRNLAVQVLKSCGYRVLDAQNGPEALTISQEYAGPIHLLLTDVVMPRMSGRELAERLQEQRPETRILYMSGYADDAIMEQGMLPAGTSLLSKPLAIESLTQRIRAVLDGRL